MTDTEKKLKILFLYPNLNMSTLVPNAISILSAVLKADGFKNVDLFDTTFYEAKKESKDEDRVKAGQIQPFNFDERGIRLKQTDMFQDFIEKVDQFDPDVIFASIVEDTFPIFKEFMEPIKDREIPVLAGGVSLRQPLRLLQVWNASVLFAEAKVKGQFWICPML